MSELSQSNDPRVRRSYAHVMLGKLSRGETDIDTAEEAVRLADQTRKGRAYKFGQALLAADRKGSWRTRPTRDMEVEIIAALPHPDGSVSPIVIGAGSHEDFARAWEEGEELGRNAEDGLDPEQVRTTHIFKSMAEAGGVVSQAAFYAGAKMGSRMELGRSEPPDPS